MQWQLKNLRGGGKTETEKPVVIVGNAKAQLRSQATTSPDHKKTKDNSLKSLQVGREKWTDYKHFTVEDRQRIFINSFLVFRLLKPIVNVPIQGDLWFFHDRYYVRPSSHRLSLGCS